MSKVCANTSQIQHSFCPHLGANNPQNLLGYKPNTWNLNLMHFTPPSGFLASYFVTFLTLKWLYYSFTIDDAISSSIFMRLYNKLVISIMWDVELGVSTPTSLGVLKLYAKTRSESNTKRSYSPIICHVLSLPTNWMANP